VKESLGLPEFRQWGKKSAQLLGVFGAVLLWLAFGPFAIYSPIGFIDPWLYTGYFTNFAYLLRHHGFTYYVSRLPWIIPGRIAFGIFSPERASLLLCAVIVTVSVISLYWMVRWHYGSTPAVLAALALITNASFMAAAGWHYPDGAAIAYGMVALAFYLRPNGSPAWNAFFAACALTLSAGTNLASTPVMLSLLVIPLWRWRHSARQLGRQGLGTLAGVAVTVLMLSILSESVLGDARVFKPQFDMLLLTANHPSYLKEMWGSGAGFLPGALNLFTPAFLLALGPVLLIGPRKPAAAARLSYLALLACCLLYAFQQFVLDEPLLRVRYHSSYMMIVISCFAGVALGELWNSRSASQREETSAAWMLAALVLALPFLSRVWRDQGIAPGGLWARIACIGAPALVLAAVLVRRPSLPVKYITLALVLTAISLGPALDSSVTSALGQPLRGSNVSDRPRAVAFRCLMQLQEYVKSNLDMEHGVNFWWDNDEPLSNLYLSAAAMYQENVDITKLLRSSSQRINPGNTTLVHLTGHPERLADRRRLLATRGLDVTNERRLEMSYGVEHFTVVLQDLTTLKGPE